MIANAIFKLCERKNLFLSSIYLRITIFAGFLTIISKLPQQQKKWLFLRIFLLQLSSHSSLRLTVQRLCINPGIQEQEMECREWGECYIPGNVAKHSVECTQTFRGISSNIRGNVAKHSGECRQHSGECSQNVLKHSGKCRQTFREM